MSSIVGIKIVGIQTSPIKYGHLEGKILLDLFIRFDEKKLYKHTLRLPQQSKDTVKNQCDLLAFVVCRLMGYGHPGRWQCRPGLKPTSSDKYYMLRRQTGQQLGQQFDLLVNLVSISSTFYNQLLRQYSCTENFLCLQLGFVIFQHKNISAKAARKMLMKLTPVLLIYVISSFENVGNFCGMRREREISSRHLKNWT